MNNTYQKLQDIDRTVTAYEKECERLQATLNWYEKEILKHERQRMEIIIQTNTTEWTHTK